jgi:hypothetical protein
LTAILMRRSSCRRRATAVLSETAEAAPTQRNRHLQCIADKGRIGWQKASGYSTTEVDVAIYILNRMLQLGRPIFVRTA